MGTNLPCGCKVQWVGPEPRGTIVHVCGKAGKTPGIKEVTMPDSIDPRCPTCFAKEPQLHPEIEAFFVKYAERDADGLIHRYHGINRPRLCTLE